MEIYVGGKRVRVNPKYAIGKGGEADIYDIGNGKALKLFKQPDHPDYRGLPQEQEGAKRRLAIHQKKLKMFPKNLPERVVTPEELASDASGVQILGYTMKFIEDSEVLFRYTDRRFRELHVPNEDVTSMFLDLHETVGGVHRAGVVIGDFNDLNVLVTQRSAYLVDADSFQFGPFLSEVFTHKFVDPLLCDPRASEPALVKPYTQFSDWYAFNVMLIQCLLFVDPYGGVYRPKDKTRLIAHRTRPLRRISIWHPEVQYPKPAIHFRVLTDDLLHYLRKVFEKDERGEFPLALFKNMIWKKCPACGIEHLRAQCPICTAIVPSALKEKVTVRGKVVATRIFKTSGAVLLVTVENGQPKWIYHEQGKFFREDKNVVLAGNLDPLMRFGIQGDTTLIGRGNTLVALRDGRIQERIAVDCVGAVPVFDSNALTKYFVQNGELLRDGPFGPEHIGNVLPQQTKIWTGNKFGFGFYRAGNLTIAFVFGLKSRGINDRVKIAPWNGQIAGTAACFTDDLCWFFLSFKDGAGIRNRVTVINKDGAIEATAEATAGDGSWLSAIQGKCAAGPYLFSPTDEGVVRLEIDAGNIVKTREFPDTEPFVDEGSSLIAGGEGLYVINRQEITLLKIQ